MVNEATARGSDPFAQKVLEQADIMRDQVARHLERARLAARLTAVGSVTEVAPVVTALARTMEKIYREKELAIEVHTDERAQFHGERPDLEEMIGNLVDNACKWAFSRVTIEVVRERPDPTSERQVIRIIVDDDGRGLSPSEREQVSKRGQRLDENEAGLRAWPFNYCGTRHTLWWQLDAWHRAARRVTRGTGVAGCLVRGLRGIAVRSFAQIMLSR